MLQIHGQLKQSFVEPYIHKWKTIRKRANSSRRLKLTKSWELSSFLDQEIKATDHLSKSLTKSFSSLAQKAIAKKPVVMSQQSVKIAYFSFCHSVRKSILDRAWYLASSGIRSSCSGLVKTNGVENWGKSKCGCEKWNNVTSCCSHFLNHFRTSYISPSRSQIAINVFSKSNTFFAVTK